MTARRLALLAVLCVLLAYPAFLIGGEVGKGVGYDASAEFAFGAALVAGLVAVVLGITALVQAIRRRSGAMVALLAVTAGLAVIGIVIRAALWAIDNIE